MYRTIAPFVEVEVNPKRTEKPAVKKTRKKPVGVKKAPAIHAFFDGMVEHIPEALIAVDDQYQVIGWNQAAERIYGWTAAEVMGRSFEDFVQTQYENTNAEQAAAKAISTGTWSDEVTQLRKDGTRFPVLSSVSSVTNESGALIGFIGINHDLGDQKRAEREAQKLFETIFHAGPTAMVLSRLSDGRFIMANQSFAILTGFDTAKELIGLTAKDAGIIVDEEVRRQRVKLLQEGMRVENYEIQVVRKSGEVRHALLTTESVLIDGEAFALTSLVDITERNQAEEQVQQMKRLYATLSQVNQTIVRVKTQEELYRSICDLAVKFGEFCLAWVGLLDEETGDVRPVAANGLALDQWPFEVVNLHHGSLKDGLSATAIRTKKVATSRDVQTDPRVKHAYEQIEKHAYHSSAAVPFRLGGKTIGVLLLVSTRVGLFDKKEEVLLLEEMGLDISFALDAMQTERVKRQWADAFEHSGHGMVIGDPHTNRIITCNPAFAREQGSTVEALTSIPLKDLYAPQDQERIGRLIAQADRDGYVQFEANKVRADGSSYPVQMDLVSVRDAGGELLYRVATQHDVTERKRAEAGLHQSEEKFSKAFRASPSALMITRLADGEYLEINKAYCDIVGYERDELIGHRTTEFNIYVYPEQRKQIVERLLADGTLHDYEVVIQNKVGERKTVLASLEVIQYNDEDCILSSMLDITGRKQLEEALERTRITLTEAQRIANLGSFEYIAATQTTAWSEEEYRIYGLDPAGPSPSYEVMLQKCIHPDDATLLHETFAQAVQSRSTYELEHRIVRPDGSIRWVYDRAHPYFDEQGELDRYIGATLDTTDRKLEQEGLQKSEERYRTLFDHMAEGYAYCQMLYENGLPQDWVYITVNQAFEKLTGLRDVTGKRVSQVIPGIRESDPGLFEIYSRVALSGGHEKFEMFVEAMQMWFSVSVYSSETGFFVAMFDVITERKQAEARVQLQLQRISALGEVDRAISASQDMTLSLNTLLREGLPPLNVDAASILLLNNSSQTLEYFAGRGFRSLAIRKTYAPLGEGLAGGVGIGRKILHIPNLAEAGERFHRADLLKEEEFVEYVGVPLIAKGSLKGILELFHRSPLDLDAEWMNYLENLSRQAAIAIDNVQLFEGMQRSNQELVAAYDATIAGWSRAMDLRDKETEGHTQRVTEVTVQLARRMGVNQYDIVQLRRGALLHDIGKLGVPDHILLKPDKLTEIEWAMMRQHPTYAFNMLLSISYLRPALDIPYCHHEKWNGEGYPRGLKEEQIPLSARIFAIVDVWDALRSNRPYRKGWPSEQIIEYLREQSGKQFDPRVVEEFLKMIDEDPNLR